MKTYRIVAWLFQTAQKLRVEFAVDTIKRLCINQCILKTSGKDLESQKLVDNEDSDHEGMSASCVNQFIWAIISRWVWVLQTFLGICFFCPSIWAWYGMVICELKYCATHVLPLNRTWRASAARSMVSADSSAGNLQC